ncbi:MAG: DUF2785 domain-containing protein [Henriciella sp.]
MKAALGVSAAVALISACATGGNVAYAQPGCDIDAETVAPQVSDALEAGSASTNLLMDLTSCLGDPRSEIRDGLAYEVLTSLLRAETVALEDRQWLLQHLSEGLGADDEGDGYLKPFQALVLGEVARTDRMERWMSVEQRKALVETAASYVEKVSDYRGFIGGEGWRHGVAHGADLLMQLSLNDAIDKADADRILAAIGAQIASHEAPAYIFDEPRRLAQPLLFLTRQGLFIEDELTAWFERLADPAPLEGWDEAFWSEKALARRHNLRAFGYAVLVPATERPDESLRKLRPGALYLLTNIP